MPIQLQNHRTSNAKLFSISGSGANKQKLHTAASLQAHRNNLKVRKNDSGTGFAMVSRMFANPTNATPNLPDAIPDRNCRQKPGARRHSMSGGPGIAAAAAAGGDVPSTVSTQGPASEQMSVSACTNSPRRRQTVASSGRSRERQQQRKDCSKSPMRRIMGSMTDASRGGTRSPMRRMISLDYSPAAPDAGDSNHSARSSSRSGTKKNVRRSRSFGPMGIGSAPAIKNIGEAIGVSTPTSSSSSMDRSSMVASRRRSTLRRGSNDSGRSAQSAATAPNATMRRPQSDPLLPLDDDDDDYVPPSPRNTLRAKREQMRRKSYGGGMAVEDEMASLALPISHQNTPRPPDTIGNLLDDIAADDSDNGDDDVSLDSFLSTSS